jgi:hypothetical protein
MSRALILVQRQLWDIKQVGATVDDLVEFEGSDFSKNADTAGSVLRDLARVASETSLRR